MSDRRYLLSAHRRLCAGQTTGATLTWQGQDYPCSVGTIERSNVLSPQGAGFSRRLLVSVHLWREDLPAVVAFRRGEAVQVTPRTGRPVAGQVLATSESGPFLGLTVGDQFEGA